LSWFCLLTPRINLCLTLPPETTEFLFVIRVKNSHVCFQDFTTNYITIEGMIFVSVLGFQIDEEREFTEQLLTSILWLCSFIGNAISIGCSFTGMLVFCHFWRICSPF
jgi:hypothetical protein